MIEVNTVFNKELCDSVTGQTNKMFIKTIAFIVLALVFLIFIKEGSEAEPFLYSLSSFSVSIVSTILAVLIISIIFLKIVEKKAQKSNLLLLQGPNVNYRFFDTYFEVNVTKEDAVIEYSKIEYTRLLKLIETKDYFLLYITGMLAHSIPKKNVPEQEFDNLKKLLKSNIKKYKQIK